jgi:hypothetical protein
MRRLTGFLAITAALVAVAATSAATWAQSEEPQWFSLTPAEIQAVQQTALRKAQDAPCAQCRVTGQWDSNWEKWLNAQAQTFTALSDGKVNGQTLEWLGYRQNMRNVWIILSDTDPEDPAEWLTLSPAEIQKIQQTFLDLNPDPGCTQCRVTGQWDSNWEKWLNDWSMSSVWRFRSLSGGKIDGLALRLLDFRPGFGEVGYQILDGVTPNEGASWVTLSSADTLKLQRALQSQCPEFFAQLKPSGAWDQAWSDGLSKWSLSDDWRPEDVAPEDWKGLELINERRLAPPLLDKLGFSLNDVKGLVP